MRVAEKSEKKRNYSSYIKPTIVVTGSSIIEIRMNDF